MYACQGTEQTRASQAYNGVGAHLRLEDKHRRLGTLVNIRDKEGEDTSARLIKKDDEGSVTGNGEKQTSCARNRRENSVAK